MDKETRNALDARMAETGVLDDNVGENVSKCLQLEDKFFAMRAWPSLAVYAVHRNHEKLFGTDSTYHSIIKMLNEMYAKLELPQKPVPGLSNSAPPVPDYDPLFGFGDDDSKHDFLDKDVPALPFRR